jgi:Ca-activated chloride channel homolog
MKASSAAMLVAGWWGLLLGLTACASGPGDGVAGDPALGSCQTAGTACVKLGPLSLPAAPASLCGQAKPRGAGGGSGGDGSYPGGVGHSAGSSSTSVPSGAGSGKGAGQGDGWAAGGSAGSGAAGPLGGGSTGGGSGKAGAAGSISAAGQGGAGGSAGAGGAGAAAGNGGCAAAGAGAGGAGDAGAGAGDGGAASCGDAGAAGGTGAASAPDAGAGAPPAPPKVPATSPEPSLCTGVDLTTPLTLYMSADDSNSMASPVIARSRIRAGKQVDPFTIRTWEFLNYYRFSFAPAAPGALEIVSQLGSCDLSEDVALQIAVVSEAAPTDRRPVNLTLVLDTSGSMAGGPMQFERATVKAIAGSLRKGDTVSAVTWSSDQTPVLEGYAVAGPSDPALLALADGLQAAGGTDLSGGLDAGYKLANQFRTPDTINRVVIISDGQANAGQTDEQLIGKNASDEDGSGIYLVGVGVGDGVNDTLMDTITDAGRGAYIFIDSPEEADRMFGARFSESVLVAARDVRIAVTLPPYYKIAQFFGEGYSPDPAKVRPQHLAPGDSMLLYQIVHPCDPSLPDAGDPLSVRVTWQDPITNAPRELEQHTTLGQLGKADANLN